LLEKHGFTAAYSNLPPVPAVNATLLLDLTQPFDSIRNGFKQTRRQNINSGLKNFNFELIEATRDDIDMFYELMLKTCNRRNVNPYI
jgi:lipid II:glycine glycyltransferase (peptidoglycan interpeptide bridge formation enzyme)